MKRTQSKQYPELRRLRGKIIYPVDIQEVSIEAEDGGTETHYNFFAVELPDHGDDLSDKTAFAKKRYAELRRLSPLPHGYGSRDEQLEMQQEQGFSVWQDHCSDVKAAWPKQ